MLRKVRTPFQPNNIRWVDEDQYKQLKSQGLIKEVLEDDSKKEPEVEESKVKYQPPKVYSAVSAKPAEAFVTKKNSVPEAEEAEGDGDTPASG